MTKLILLSGFLGSGKTTLMVELALAFQRDGIKTAVMTNDQSGRLVDTDYARQAGLTTGEIGGGCFCCRFPDFMETLFELIRENNPSYVIAEAVGSCTDLKATVIEPIRRFHSDKLELAGFLTLADGQRCAGSFGKMNLQHPVTPEETLLSHQLREASFLVLTKTDLLSEQGKESVRTFLGRLNDSAPVLPCCARTGDGMAELMDKLKEGLPQPDSRLIPLDYEAYGLAEARYGWYNGNWNMEGGKDDALEISMDVMESFRNPDLGDVAHGKLVILTPRGTLKVSFVSGSIQADQIPAGKGEVGKMEVNLNIRAACSPEKLVDHVEEIQGGLRKRGWIICSYHKEALVPGKPSPWYKSDC